MQQLAERLLSIAEEEADPAMLQVAHTAMGESLVRLGGYVAACQHFEQSISFADMEQQRTLAVRYAFAPLVQGLTRGAQTIWERGYPDWAIEQSKQALPLAEELDHPLSFVYALFHTSRLLLACGDVHTARVRLERCMVLANDQQFPLFLESSRVHLGYLLAREGQPEEGIAQIRQGMTGMFDTGHRLSLPINSYLLAEAYCMHGQNEEGLRLVAEAQSHLNETRQHYYEPELYRIKGELLLKQAPCDTSEAETCFNQAREIASRQEAKSWELRAATSLARLWQSQGKGQEAYDLLAPVYEWFTEGFDTADLQEAKLLLAKLEG